MGLRIGVVGAGAAGVAAAWAGARSGAQVSLFSAQAGASSLTAGALDLSPPGDPPSGAEAELGPELFEFASALRQWTVQDGVIATRQGVVRSVRGYDLALLDLTTVQGRRVAVADLERDDWDAPALARTLSVSPWARRTGTEFVARAVPALRRGAERRISAFDFAELHNHPERAEWLAALLRRSSEDVAGWLVGSWLGTEPEIVPLLRERLGLPLGEVTSPLGGPAGARFDRARDRLLQELGVTRVEQRVTAIERRGASWLVRTVSAEFEFDGVVLASGGMTTGSTVLVLDPTRGRAGFELQIDAPGRLVLDGESADRASSLFGPDFVAAGFGALERVGLELTPRGFVRGADGAEVVGLAAAGDCVAGRPRTLLEAIRSGCAALRTVTLGRA